MGFNKIIETIKTMEQHLALINQKGNKVKVPAWAKYVKTSSAKELAPYDDDWLYTRAASIAYQLYMRKQCGVNALRKHYGGSKRFGTCTEHYRKAAGKNIRYCMKELIAAGHVGRANYVSAENVTVQIGKSLLPKGRTDMDRIA